MFGPNFIIIVTKIPSIQIYFTVFLPPVLGQGQTWSNFPSYEQERTSRENIYVCVSMDMGIPLGKISFRPVWPPSCLIKVSKVCPIVYNLPIILWYNKILSRGFKRKLKYFFGCLESFKTYAHNYADDTAIFSSSPEPVEEGCYKWTLKSVARSHSPSREVRVQLYTSATSNSP